MNDYISLRLDLKPCSVDATDLLAAFLADEGYESFESDETGLTAYIKSDSFDEDSVRGILDNFPMPLEAEVSYELVEGRDWNEEWEKNYFQPIVIDDKCVIHSTFHKNVPNGQYDILIDPKMAFGTGHHATTSMMLRHILKTDMQGKRVIDMGTGTGILAILSMMLGATEAYGIEIDPGACRNAEENVILNNVKVQILEGDASLLDTLPQADLFIANINRNVILADLASYLKALKHDGQLLLSGFYETDIPLIERQARMLGAELIEKMTMEDPGLSEKDPAASHGPWASIRLIKL